MLGTLFSSSLDAACAPSGHVLLRSLLGGARRPAVGSLGDAELLALVAHECGPPLGLRRAPLFAHVSRWEGALPRYDLEHPARQRALENTLPPDLALLGNYERGIGLGGLVERARELALRDAAAAAG